VNGKHIAVTRRPNNEWDWGGRDVDIVIETTGKITQRDDLAGHLACGAKKVIISAPGKDPDATIVMGVNEDIYNPDEHSVISAASCTTNCLAPATKVLLDHFGVKHGLMTTIHAYTMGQRILDGSAKDLRRGRAAAMSMIPTSTGAARAIGLVIPELKGKMDGISVRVPTPVVSMVDVVYELGRDTTTKEVNEVLKAAVPLMKGSLGYSEEPLVSIDYTGDSHGGVVDSLCTKVMDKRMLQLLIWYDNEAGFTHQLIRLMNMVGASL
jgi:glyceraldehyde 3-phosphate dehydrogenase